MSTWLARSDGIMEKIDRFRTSDTMPPLRGGRWHSNRDSQYIQIQRSCRLVESLRTEVDCTWRCSSSNNSEKWNPSRIHRTFLSLHEISVACLLDLMSIPRDFYTKASARFLGSSWSDAVMYGSIFGILLIYSWWYRIAPTWFVDGISHLRLQERDRWLSISGTANFRAIEWLSQCSQKRLRNFRAHPGTILLLDIYVSVRNSSQTDIEQRYIVNHWPRRSWYWDIRCSVLSKVAANCAASFARGHAVTCPVSKNSALENIFHLYSLLSSVFYGPLTVSLRFNARGRIEGLSCHWEMMSWKNLPSQFLYRSHFTLHERRVFDSSYLTLCSVTFIPPTFSA
jgi:hypothetical protein